MSFMSQSPLATNALLLFESGLRDQQRELMYAIERGQKEICALADSGPGDVIDDSNIRELQNVIERSVIVCETETFTVDESWLYRQPRDRRSGQLYLPQKLAAKEKEIIEEALRESQGRVFGPSGAAAKLGIARSTLESKIQSLNINKKRFKSRPGIEDSPVIAHQRAS